MTRVSSPSCGGHGITRILTLNERDFRPFADIVALGL